MATMWTVVGFNSTDEFFRTKVSILPGEAQQLVRTLAARHLSDQEIADAFAGRNSLLEVRSDGGAKTPTVTCGENPHYVASED